MVAFPLIVTLYTVHTKGYLGNMCLAWSSFHTIFEAYSLLTVSIGMCYTPHYRSDCLNICEKIKYKCLSQR